MTVFDARARVTRLLEAAARLADEGDALHAEALARLPGETGLSVEGVALGLRHSVERGASEAEMSALLASVRPARRVQVVLAANVFASVVRAAALGWASAPVVRLRPSRRAPTMASLLARAVARTPGPGTLELADPGSSIQVEEGDVVHAYGSDATLAALGARLGPGVPLWGHGHGVGVLVGEAGGAEAGAPALDVALFDQQGCLSPRLALVVGDEAAAVDLAGRAFAAIDEATRAVPAGPASAAERAARGAFVETLRATGEVWANERLVVGHLREPAARLWPGFARGLLVASYGRPGDAVAALGAMAPHVTCVGAWGPLPGVWRAALASAAPGARWTVAGQMQRPALDGPVDLRTPHP